MSRPKFQIDPTAIYNIGGRCRNKDWYDLPMERVWEIFENQLFFLHHAFKIEILSFVLMANHFHLLVRSPLGNLSVAMAYLMRETTREIQRESKRINQIWGGRFYRCKLDSFWSFTNCYKYNYRNPVAAGLVSRVEDYPYSTLRGVIGFQKILIPVAHDTLLFGDGIQSHLEWLNTKPDKEAVNSIKRALKHLEFKLPKINQRENPWAKTRI